MIDIKKITEQTTKYNFHTHTQFCDGRDSIADITEAAVESGFLHLGFSPHSPIPFDSPCNMSKDSLPLYFEELNRMRDKYGTRINIYTSMEIDYISDDWGPANPYFKSLNLDYAIGSVHFIPYRDGEYVDIDGRFENFKKKMGIYFDNDIKAVVESFYHQSMAMIEAGGFDIIGHFDKIGHNAGDFCLGIEDEPWYLALVKKEFEAIMDCGLIVEINTKAFANFNRFFPNARFFEWLRRYKTPVVVNSDAHYAGLINAGRDEAFKFLFDVK